MHKCVVCSNTETYTKLNRPDVMYHTIPKNEYRKRRWLKSLGIHRYCDWYRVCSDHFLKRDYRPGVRRILWPNSIPQPVVQNYEENGLSYGYTTQKNDVQSANNTFLPMNELMTDEEIDRNIIVLNIDETPRRSSRKIKLTTTNKDMSYENMPRLQTQRFEGTIPTCGIDNNIEVVPKLTTPKVHSSVNRLRCSVKNCFNRYSEDLSFFGYPKNDTLRKEWIEKCGLVNVDPTKKLKSNLKVCRVHFTEDCFANLAKKNRLRTNAVPSLFLGNDIIDERNIPSTNSLDNSGFIPVNKPSYSSSNYLANVDSCQVPLGVLIGSNNRQLEDFENFKCCVPGCIMNKTNVKLNEDVPLFIVPMESIDDWSPLLRVQLTKKSVVCSLHFREEDLVLSKLLLNKQHEIVKTLVPGALPIPNTFVPLATNAVPVLKTREGKFRRPRANKADEHILPTKKIRNNVIDKSKVTTETIYISGDKNEYTSATNNTHQYISTCDLNPTLKSNIAQIKNPPNNTDNCSTSNTSESRLKYILPKILANRSLSLTLQPKNKITSHKSTIKPNITVSKNIKPVFDSSKIKNEPSGIDVYDSQGLHFDPMYIQPSDENWISGSELSTELSDVNQTFTNDYTSTGTQSVKTEPDDYLSSLNDSLSSSPPLLSTDDLLFTYNVPQNKSMQYECGAASTSSNSVIHMKPFKIENFEIEDFTEVDNGFIYEISKIAALPSKFWNILRDHNKNFTAFCKQNYYQVIFKQICFFNSLKPIIRVYGKKYIYNNPITTKIELDILLKKVDNVKNCSGIDGFVHKNCIGYVENCSEDIKVCSACQELVEHQDLAEIIVIDEDETIDVSNSEISEREARRRMLPNSSLSRAINITEPRH